MDLARPATSPGITFAAHIPSKDGYNPLVPEYGDARIEAAPSDRLPTFSTLEAAIAAARTESDQMDTAASVFKAKEGVYQLGLAFHHGDEGREELMFGPETAHDIVFDDPKLEALVWLDAVARRP